jgi:hypothetical protein
MDPVFNLLFYLVAAVCFGLAAFGVSVTRVSLLALGLLAWVLVPTIATLVVVAR